MQISCMASVIDAANIVTAADIRKDEMYMPDWPK